MIEITDFSSYIIWLEKKFDKMCMAYINIYIRSAGLISNPRAKKKEKKSLAHNVSLIVFTKNGVEVGKTWLTM